MRNTRQRVSHRRPGGSGVQWLSFSDLMSALLLIFILIMFYIMYQYFDMYEINMAEIARQQYDLDQANADLNEKTEKLTAAEQQMLAQQIRLDAAQKDLDDAESVLAAQQAELASAQSLLGEKETEIANQKAALDALGLQLNAQQEQITQQRQTLNTQRQTLNAQQQTMNEQQIKLDEQQQTVDAQQAMLDAQQLTMNAQQVKLDEQQQTLQDQQQQIEQLVGLKTRIITSLSSALRAANISAQVDPTNGAIALESDVLFAYNKYELTESGKQFIDRFLPVYLNVLFSADYRPYVAEILVEGHTDTTGDYITNLRLSQQRALAVASYVLADDYAGITADQKRQLRELVTANGRSFSDPVRDANGNVDMDASRRVVFKFRMTDEQMIQQLKAILEESGGE